MLKMFAKLVFKTNSFVGKDFKVCSQWDTSLVISKRILNIQTLKATKYRRWLPLLVYLIALMCGKRLVPLNKHSSLREELEPQLPITTLFKKCMLCDMLVSCDEK